MTKSSIKLLLLFVLALTYSCKTTQSINKVSGAVELTVPFSENKYKSDNDSFRAKSSGVSIDLATAKKKAMMNAKTELGGVISSVMKAVTDQYINDRTVNENDDFENKFEELSRNIVNQTLSDVRIMDEKIFRETNNKYTYWVAIETSKQVVLKTMNDKINKNEKLQLDYDKMKFEAIFNSEMEKLEKQQN